MEGFSHQRAGTRSYNARARIGDGLLRHRSIASHTGWLGTRAHKASKQASKPTWTQPHTCSGWPRPASKLHSQPGMRHTRAALTHHAAAQESSKPQRPGSRQLLGGGIFCATRSTPPQLHAAIDECSTVYIIASGRGWWQVFGEFAGPRMWLVRVGKLAYGR
jgi:hypothetical protein